MCSKGTNDATRAQINYVPNKSHVIIIIVNRQGQIIQNIESLLNVPFREPNDKCAGCKCICDPVHEKVPNGEAKKRTKTR